MALAASALAHLGSTWSPPRELRAAWVGTSVEVTTPSYEYHQCVGRFQLSDGVQRTFWEQTVASDSTVLVEPIAPVPIAGLSTDHAPLMLTFQAWCEDVEGRQLERVHLAGTFVEPSGDRVVPAASSRVDQVVRRGASGTVLVGGPAGVLVEGAEPLGPMTDDVPQEVE